MYKNIHNIIFDFGGVICDLLPERCIQEFLKLGGNIEIFPTQYSQFSGIFQQIDRGTITPQQFRDAMRQQANIPQATDQQITDAWNSLLGSIPDERFLAFKKLKQHHDIFILSNCNDIHWQEIYNHRMNFEGEHVIPWFKQIFLSYVMHLEKPEPEIYQTVLQSAGIKAEETLFLDDNLPNLEAATRLGIQTLHTKNGDWVEKLKDLIE